MAKIQIKSEKLTPFGGIFSIMEKFDSMLSPVIDSTLGQRCRSIIGYTILRAIKELTQENISYTSDKGKTFQNWIRIKSVPYGFNLRIASSRIVG